jgi:hypothetical protein
MNGRFRGSFLAIFHAKISPVLMKIVFFFEGYPRSAFFTIMAVHAEALR